MNEAKAFEIVTKSLQDAEIIPLWECGVPICSWDCRWHLLDNPRRKCRINQAMEPVTCRPAIDTMRDVIFALALHEQGGER